MASEFYNSPLFVCGSFILVILFLLGGSWIMSLYEKEVEKRWLEKEDPEEQERVGRWVAQYQPITNRSLAEYRSTGRVRLSSTKGYVYLLKSPTGHYKIGKATYPDKRLKEIELLLPFEVERIHLIDCEDYNHAETHLHRRFASKRTNGEWFLLNEEDVAAIKAIERM